jgi:2-hydroxymuconate-semialdehyde hydrolase
MTTAATDPEVGLRLAYGAFVTNYHDADTRSAVLLIHGSGPGVTAWANWRLVLPELATRHRVIAPDVVGSGYTEYAADRVLSLDVWLEHAVSLLDALGLARVSVVATPSAARSGSGLRRCTRARSIASS